MELHAAIKKAHERINGLVNWNRDQDQRLDEMEKAWTELRDELTRTRTGLSALKHYQKIAETTPEAVQLTAVEDKKEATGS